MDESDLNKTVYIRGDELSKSVIRYRNLMDRLEADLPIECLCLPKVIEKKLVNAGCLRVYDVIDVDLTKIKGLGDRRIALLRSCIEQFLPVSF